MLTAEIDNVLMLVATEIRASEDSTADASWPLRASSLSYDHAALRLSKRDTKPIHGLHELKSGLRLS